MISKKSQMEILGLAIVVLLMLVATTFVVRFLMLQKPTDYGQSFISSELASNMLNTFLRIAADGCSQLTMTELLQDCAQSKIITCDNGEDSCSHVEAIAKSIFSQTFDKWKIKYEFLVCTNFDSKALKCTDTAYQLIKLGDECNEGRKSELFYIPTSTNTISSKLDICT